MSIAVATPIDSPDQDPLVPVLLPYQVDGVDFLEAHPRALLLDEPGLGKTVQTLALMARLLARDELGRVLVATDSTMLGKQWLGELRTWLPAVPAFQIDTSGKTQAAFLNTEGPAVLVTTYAMINSRKDWMDTASNRQRWSLVVLDELSTLKGGNKQFTAAQDVARRADRVVGLTATLLENSGCDVWAALAAVGTPDLWPRSVFDDRFVEWTEFKMTVGRKSWIERTATGLKPAGVPELTSYLDGFSLRRTVEGSAQTLPVRVGEQFRFVEPTPQQRQAITKASKSADPFWRARTLDAACAFTNGTSGKALAAVDWIVDNRQHGKIIVYAEHMEHLNIMEALLTERRIGYIRMQGSTKKDDRPEMLDQFEADPSIRVLLGSRVLERGLNIQCASALLSLGSSWNPAREAQREGRIRRIGSVHATYEHVTFLLDTPRERDQLMTKLGRKRDDASKLH